MPTAAQGAGGFGDVKTTMLSDVSTVAGQDRASLSPGLHGLVVVLVLLMVSAAALFSLPRASQVEAEPVAILFPPWVSRADAIARSFATGHRVLRSGRWPSIVVVAPGTGAALTRQKPPGAMLVVALAGLAGCLDSPVQPGTAA